MFNDWNGNGKKDDMFDNSMDWYIINEANKNNSNGRGCCCGGLFLLLLITLPVWAPVALTLNAAGIIETHDDYNEKQYASVRDYADSEGAAMGDVDR